MSVTRMEAPAISSKRNPGSPSGESQLSVIIPVTSDQGQDHLVAKPDLRASEPDDMKVAFLSLAELWRRETATISSTDDLINHPAYQSIIAIGPSVVPLILRELETQPDHWFFALRTLTAENPVDPKDRGKIDKMSAAWVQWGREKGYL